MEQPAQAPVVCLTVTREACNFILASLAEHPHKVVAPLVDELQGQIRMQDATHSNHAAQAEPLQAAAAPNAWDATPAARPNRRERRARRQGRGK